MSSAGSNANIVAKETDDDAQSLNVKLIINVALFCRKKKLST